LVWAPMTGKTTQNVRWEKKMGAESLVVVVGEGYSPRNVVKKKKPTKERTW